MFASAIDYKSFTQLLNTDLAQSKLWRDSYSQTINFFNTNNVIIIKRN